MLDISLIKQPKDYIQLWYFHVKPVVVQHPFSILTWSSTLPIKWPSPRKGHEPWSDVCAVFLLFLFAHFAAVPKVRIMRVDVAPCGLIMSKCLRGQMRKYRCWRVRGASLHASAVCPLPSLSCCTAQWTCCCHSMQAHGWPTYTPCPQTGRLLAVSVAVLTLCWDSSKLHKVTLNSRHEF